MTARDGYISTSYLLQVNNSSRKFHNPKIYLLPVMAKYTGGSSFPQFSLLPVELRCQIWELALMPTPTVSTIILSSSLLDPLDPQAYDGPSFELVEGNLWHFAFTPRRSLPAVLFTSREAFTVGRKYYDTARQIGYEIVGKSIINHLTTDTAEAIAEDYNDSMPAIKRKERTIPCSTNDIVHVTINPTVSIQKDYSLSHHHHHAISDLHPLIFKGIKYLVMDAMDFYRRIYVMNSNSLLFSGLEVLFLVMRRYDDNGGGGWEISNEAGLNFLSPWERTDLEAGTAKWNVDKLNFVRSIEDAMERVQRRDS